MGAQSDILRPRPEELTTIVRQALIKKSDEVDSTHDDGTGELRRRFIPYWLPPSSRAAGSNSSLARPAGIGVAAEINVTVRSGHGQRSPVLPVAADDGILLSSLVSGSGHRRGAEAGPSHSRPGF